VQQLQQRLQHLLRCEQLLQQLQQPCWSAARWQPGWLWQQ
jgi:hypothetical protein